MTKTDIEWLEYANEFHYDNHPEINTAVKHAIEALERTRWIPVSERLPVNSNLIMFYTKYDGMRMGRFNGDDWNTVCNVKFSKMAVTHWMPLPNPPQEVE